MVTKTVWFPTFFKKIFFYTLLQMKENHKGMVWHEWANFWVDNHKYVNATFTLLILINWT